MIIAVGKHSPQKFLFGIFVFNTSTNLSIMFKFNGLTLLYLLYLIALKSLNHFPLKLFLIYTTVAKTINV